ncbi:hypothetical protein [Desulfolutivibrio sp.]|uniref:hypothetical protein n=1 Tax=Desulfolutivibrio sp. TaxID=2773296 RepID=UPI002F96B1A9
MFLEKDGRIFQGGATGVASTQRRFLFFCEEKSEIQDVAICQTMTEMTERNMRAVSSTWADTTDEATA